MKRAKLSVLVVLSLFALVLVAAVHPLVDHFGETASGGAGTFGSKWIHTDTSGVRYGLWSESASSDARGVFGNATTTSGSGLAIGVYGETSSPTGRGVHGYVSSGSGENYGVTGSTNSLDSQAAGVHGFNNRTSTGSTRGVQGTVKSTYGYGVIGFLDPSGAGEGAGVYGANSASSGAGSGIYGYNLSSNGWGATITSVSNGMAIFASPGKVGLVVNNGSKNASVYTEDGDRLMYSEESTEVWFSDYGFGVIESGSALVEIDSVFAETVNLDEPYHVFLQAYGDTTLFVTNRTKTSFEVKASDDSVTTLEFSYRIVAKRLGFESDRLEFAPWVTDEQRHYQQPEPPEPPELAFEDAVFSGE